MRPLSGIRELLAESKEKAGCTIELPWTTKKPGQRFILTVTSQATSLIANWSLYEENEIESRVIWSQPWAPSDLDLMYDMVVMYTDPSSTEHAKIPEHLKPPPEPPGDDGGQTKNNGTATPNSQQPAAANPAQAGMAPAYPYPAQPGQPYPPGMPYPMPNQPMAYPPQQGQQGYPQPQQGYPQPQQGYPQPQQGYPQPQQGYPQPQQGYPQPPQGYPQPQQGYPQPQQGYAPQAHPNYPSPPANSWQYGSPSAPQSQGPGASVNPNAQQLPALPIEMNLSQKQPNILLGTLLTDAELITEPTLDAALKIQDLVRAGRLSASRAAEILKLFFSMGSAIEDYIDPSDFLQTGPEKKESDKQGRDKQERDRQEHAKQTLAPDTDELRQAFALLIKAGLLTEGDIETATKVRAKHGGDLRNILQAAGKVDEKTMSAAMICASLIKTGTMKVEQCIIAVNFCNRSRVGFDEALEELNWENPRKSGKKP